MTAVTTVGVDVSFFGGPRAGVATYSAKLCEALVELAVPDLELLAWTGLRAVPLREWRASTSDGTGAKGTTSRHLRAALRRAGPLHRAVRRIRDALAPEFDLF